MIASSPFPSISSVGQRIGTLAAEHIDLTFRALLRGPDVTIDDRFVRLITDEPHPFGNFALLADADDLDAAAAAVEPLLTCPAPSAVLLTAPAPAALTAQLKAAGFERHDGLPAMAVEIGELGPTALPAGYTFVRYSRAEQRPVWADAFARGYELPRRVGEQFAEGIGAGASDSAPMQYFAIVKNDKPVCTSMVYMHDGVAGIYGVATLAEERGRGLGAYATAQPLRIAHDMGYRVGVLQASAAGHSVYQRLGFTDVGDVPLFVRMPS